MQYNSLFAFVMGAVLGSILVYFKFKSRHLKLEAELNLLNKQQEQQQDLEEKMSKHFQLLAAQVMEDKSSKLTDLSTKNLNLLLEPFKEKLKDFEKKVDEVYAAERSERGTLRGELNKLLELNIKMSSEAESLTRALKGDVKAQGNWGEMILENILERSGLRKGEEYITQGSELNLRNDEGQIIRPDVIINLPDSKHIIVDSKVSLVAYETYAKATDSEEQERYGKLHIESLKKHIDGLAGKKYPTASKISSPDFVILFMPLEPAFALAFRLKPELFQEAFEKGIAIVSPTTLLATLRTVAHIWKNERQERNVLEIAKRGGALYDKFAGIMSDLETVGKKIEDAGKSHQQVMKKMSEGQGNLLWQVENLRELGIKTDKKIQAPRLEN